VSAPVKSHGKTFFTRVVATLVRSKIAESLKWVWFSSKSLAGYWSWPKRGWLQ
jgi:hypothetical protein